jgi:hypothetical protein
MARTFLALSIIFIFSCSARSGVPLDNPDGGGGADTPSGTDAPAGDPCATICAGDGPNCGSGCIQRCGALTTLFPRCTTQANAALRCAADNGYRCPPASMAVALPPACMAQQQAFEACAMMP